MAQTVARFEGTEEMIQNLENMKARVLNKGLKAAFMAAGAIVRDEAAARAPRLTGRLSEGMTLEWEGRKHRAKVGPHKDTYYGDFLERGTSRMAAHPFLRPALDARREDAFRAMAKELKQTIEAKR